MNSIEFGDFTGNLSPIDLNLHWFHQAMLTDRFLILPLTSINMNISKVLKLIVQGKFTADFQPGRHFVLDKPKFNFRNVT